jgi:hypothetical protein
MEQLSVGYQPPAAFNSKYPDPDFYQYQYNKYIASVENPIDEESSTVAS